MTSGHTLVQLIRHVNPDILDPSSEVKQTPFGIEKPTENPLSTYPIDPGNAPKGLAASCCRSGSLTPNDLHHLVLKKRDWSPDLEALLSPMPSGTRTTLISSTSSSAKSRAKNDWRGPGDCLRTWALESALSVLSSTSRIRRKRRCSHEHHRCPKRTVPFAVPTGGRVRHPPEVARIHP